MTAELGHFTLILALFVAIVQATLPLVGAARNHTPWIALSNPTAYCQFALVAISFGCLTHLFITSDFSVLNVVQNSHTDKPMLYKISGVWGNHEGSFTTHGDADAQAIRRIDRLCPVGRAHADDR